MTKAKTRQKRTSRKTPDDPVTAYARRVVDGTILAGRLVRMACARHLRDLTDGPKRGLRWDLGSRTTPQTALWAIGFFERVLHLNGGEWEGDPFILRDWQAFIVGSLFGWKGPDGYRRFRVGYIEIAKGNGKSPMAAGVGHLMAWGDREPRAEVYAAATKKDQAMILFRDAVAMTDLSPALSKRITKSGGNPVWNLADLKSGSFFRPIASEDSQSGPRPHCGLVDEIHEHKDATVVEMMRAGTKGRRQALIFMVTNSGTDQSSVCYDHRQYCEALLENATAPEPDPDLLDDARFAYVATLDPCQTCLDEGHRQPSEDCAHCDDWRDEAVWPKANPNLGVSIDPKYLREQVTEARGMPSKENVVKRLNFGLWVQSSVHAIPMHLWDMGATPVDPDVLKGRLCFGGMDLAKVDDLSAFVLLFPPVMDDEPWKVLPWFWCPEDNIVERARRANPIPYAAWRDRGYLLETPGNVTDYAFIEHTILEATRDYDVQELSYDRTFGGEIVQHLQAEGVTMVEFGQGYLSMAAPTAELLRLVKSGKLNHGGHPVLRWNASNLVTRQDPANNLKPDKERSPDKIDGIAALCNALGRAMTAEPVGSDMGIDFA
jgi:phage terminase large subunit-like protein